jgi:toxin ParE1/3/4
MRRLRITAGAQADRRHLLTISYATFGSAAQRRYDALIKRAYAAVRIDPSRAGVTARDDLPGDVRLFHLRHVRTRGMSPKEPRHFIVFAFDDATLTILRVLHEAMDIAAHVSGEDDS